MFVLINFDMLEIRQGTESSLLIVINFNNKKTVIFVIRDTFGNVTIIKLWKVFNNFKVVSPFELLKFIEK